MTSICSCSYSFNASSILFSINQKDVLSLKKENYLINEGIIEAHEEKNLFFQFWLEKDLIYKKNSHFHGKIKIELEELK